MMDMGSSTMSPSEPVQVQPALASAGASPGLDPVHDGLALVPGDEFVHPDGAGVVGHDRRPTTQAPRFFSSRLLHGKDIALHRPPCPCPAPASPMGTVGLRFLMACPKMRLAGGLALPFPLALAAGMASLVAFCAAPRPLNGLRSARRRPSPVPCSPPAEDGARAGLGRGGWHRRSRRLPAEHLHQGGAALAAPGPPSGRIHCRLRP